MVNVVLQMASNRLRHLMHVAGVRITACSEQAAAGWNWFSRSAASCRYPELFELVDLTDLPVMW